MPEGDSPSFTLQIRQVTLDEVIRLRLLFLDRVDRVHLLYSSVPSMGTELTYLCKSLNDISDFSSVSPPSSIPFPLHQSFFYWTVVDSCVLAELAVFSQGPEGIDGFGDGLCELGI